jgi:hypothetical protein
MGVLMSQTTFPNHHRVCRVRLLVLIFPLPSSRENPTASIPKIVGDVKIYTQTTALDKDGASILAGAHIQAITRPSFFTFISQIIMFFVPDSPLATIINLSPSEGEVTL